LRSRFYFLAIVVCACSTAQAASPSVKLEQNAQGQWLVRIVEAGNTALTVFVDSSDSQLPPLLGTVSAQGRDRLFHPRFPLQPGLAYRAVIATAPPVILKFAIPTTAARTTTRIDAVYPSADLLPENQLKFYIHFSNSMARGDAYRWIRLLNDSGNRIDVPFLELSEELWDPEYKRLTLYFDPGRVKSDLLPGREMGAPLRAGKRYTLLLDADWPDAKGNRLSASFRKEFQVGVADHAPPDPQAWRIRAPHAATTDALVVEFAEPMERALLFRMIHVVAADGQAMAGAIEVDNNETRWRFTPDIAWRAGAYAVRANTALEDLAGNKLNRPFEFVGARTPAQRASAEYVTIPLRIERATQ